MTFDQTPLRKITHARKFASLLVGAGNVGLVSRYKKLGLGSNDPNLVTGDAAGLISDFTSLYGQSFFNQAWAMFHKQADRTLVEVLEAIAKLFRPG